MKRNLILLALAIGLGSFTYYYQELGDRQEREEEKHKGMLLDPAVLGELKAFRLPEVDITKQGDQYLFPDSGGLADERKVDWFFSILSGIRAKRIIPKEKWEQSKRSEFFPNDNEEMTFIFENGQVTFLLGKKLEFDRSFYIEVKNGEKVSHVVAFDSGPLDTAYEKKEGHRADHHFRRFQSLFYLSKDFFRDYRFFRHWMHKKWSLLEVAVDSTRNIAYSINFPEGQTSPKVPFFLSLKTEVVLAFEKRVVHLEGKSFAAKEDQNFFEEPLSTMKINSTLGAATLTLLRSKRDKKAHFIKSSLDEFFYKIDEKTAKVLFLNIQDFWSKKIWEQRPNEMTFRFPNREEQKVSFKYDNGAFKAFPDALHAPFKKFVDFFSKPADYWSAGDSLKDGFIHQFTVDWGKGPFFLMIRTGEVLLYHKESKQGLIYSIEGLPPFPLIGNEYFL